MRSGLYKQYLLLFICLTCVFSFSLYAEEIDTLNINMGEEYKKDVNSSEEIKNEEQCKVSNIFIEIEIRQALNEISTQCGIPIIIDDMVHGYVPLLEADNMPIEECLSLILKSGGYFFKKVDDYYIVTNPNPISPLFSQISETERVRPKHLKANDILSLLPQSYTAYIKTDEITNSLIVTAIPEIINKIKEHIDKIDQPPPQVMIEALITEVSSIGSKKLGIDWQVDLSEEKESSSIHSGSIGLETLTGTINYMNTGRAIQRVITTLKLLVEKGEAKIKANPKIIALNGETADIHIGKEQYYILQAPAGSTYTYSRFESIETGITLKITPYVYDSGEITVTIEPEVSDVLGEGVDASPVISRRRAKTTVTVKDGQPIVIGGLQLSTESSLKSGYPCIGDIPFLGLLFQSRRKNVLQNEIIIIITPHIYNIGQTQLIINNIQ